MKRFSIIIVTVLIVVGCALWSPWNNINFDWRTLIGIEIPPSFSTIQINSLGGELELYVDDERRGIVGTDSDVLILEDIPPGNRQIRLVRPTESENADYYIFQSLLNFSEEIDTIIAYELGPNEQFSKGHTISAYRNFLNNNSTALTVNSTPEGATVRLNDRIIGNTPLSGYEISRSDVIELELSQQGYEDMTITLLPESEEDRESLAGYDIVVEANLFLIPIEIREVVNDG